MTPPTTDSPAPTPAASAEQQQQQQQPHGDPDEVDISQHYYAPQTTNRIPSPAAGGGDPANISEDQLRQMMLGFDRPAPGGGAPGEPDLAEDPMMKMLQQMMGGAGGGGMPPFGAQNSPFGDGAANPFAAMGMGMPGMPGMGPQQQTTPQQAASDAYAAMWRVLHFLVALGLGLYIALLTSFSGSKIARERDAVARGFVGGPPGTPEADGGGADAADLRRYFFWAFATAETVLLTSRFFLDRGRAAPQGMLGTIMGFLPDSAWKGYLDVALRYSQIFSTVRSDMLVCVFVLGVCAWLRS